MKQVVDDEDHIGLDMKVTKHGNDREGNTEMKRQD